MRKLRPGWVEKAPGQASNVWVSSNLKLKAQQVKATGETFKALRKPTDSRLAPWLLVGEGLAKSLRRALKIPETFRVSSNSPGAVWFKHFPHWEWSRDLRHILLFPDLEPVWKGCQVLSMLWLGPLRKDGLWLYRRHGNFTLRCSLTFSELCLI